MKTHAVNFRAMGSPCSVRLYAASAMEAQILAAPVIDEVERLEQRYSRYRPSSFLSQINASAGKHTIAIDEETQALLAYAMAAYEQSEGLFDLTSGVLRTVWDFRAKKIPTQSEVDRVLPLIGMDKLEIREGRLYLPLAGMELDFGGCVKEYAADSAAKVALEQGISAGVIELGGDVRIIGPHPNGEAWDMGIRTPRQAHNPVLTRVGLSEGALASSGDYERYTVVNDVRYCHILNPKTGWPVTPPASVSVIAPSCIVAGSVCTIAMLMGEDDCVAWLESVGLPYCVVWGSGKVRNQF